MQNTKEQQGEIRKPSSVISAKKMEENNRMGKTRDLFNKIRDSKGNISCKDGLNKGQKLQGHNRKGLRRDGRIQRAVQKRSSRPR